jgi:hypothetical protein
MTPPLVKRLVRSYPDDTPPDPLVLFVGASQGQLLITTGAIAWTTDCSKALVQIAGGNKNALKALKKKQVRNNQP